MREVVAADDVGRVIHPVLCEGQVEGGTLQAVGYATIEEIKVRDGRYLNDRLATYLIPTALDAPRIETILVEAPFPLAPHGVKGVGELPMDVGAPAVIAAIHDAVGVWVTELPATPEKLFVALANGSDVAGPFARSGETAVDRSVEGPIVAGTDPRRTHPPTRSRSARRPIPATRDDRHPLPGQRRARRGRRTRVPPPARRAARGPRSHGHEGGLRRGRMRRVLGPRRRRGRRRVPHRRRRRSTAA